MSAQIVKVQIALQAYGGADLPGDHRGLVYDRSRAVLVEQPLDLSTVAALRGDKKGYFMATLSPDGTWIIAGRVEAQDW